MSAVLRSVFFFRNGHAIEGYPAKPDRVNQAAATITVFFRGGMP